jgi:putative bacteriocin precursor
MERRKQFMKKLGKKFDSNTETVESYDACYCSCHCVCRRICGGGTISVTLDNQEYYSSDNYNDFKLQNADYNSNLPNGLK